MGSQEMTHLVLRGAILGVTACLSAFFSGSETALFSLPPEELRRMGGSGGTGRIVARLLSTPKRLLTTVLFGNTFVNVIFFSVSFLLIAEHKESLGPMRSGLLWVASVLAIVVFCEVLPKNVAVLHPRPLSRAAAVPLAVFETVFGPLIFTLEKVTDWISSLFDRYLKQEPFIRPEELQMLIDLSEKDGVLDRDIGEMIAEVVKLSETDIREVMVPRVEIACFNLAGPASELGELFRREKHRLIPVYEERVDNMLGVIHAKDFLLRSDMEELHELIRPIPFVPETATVEEVLGQFREQQTRMAFVVDEYGAVEGLVTVEDMLEEIVGEIGDEYDIERPAPVERIDERRFRLRGDLSVREWHEMFEMEAPQLSVDTVAGLVMTLLDRVPQAGDRVRYRNLELTVEKTRGRRMLSVILELADDGGGAGGDA